MKWRYKRSQIFRKRLSVPSEVEQSIYNSQLPLEQYISFDLMDKVPISCITPEDRKIVEKFGIEKVKQLDWELLHILELSKPTGIASNINLDSRKLLMSINPSEVDLNTGLYELVKDIIPPYEYSKKMKKIYSDRLFERKREDYEVFRNNRSLADIKYDFNSGRTTLKEIIQDWELYKEKDLGYCLLRDPENKYEITDSQIKKFMAEFADIAVLISETAPIYSVINNINNINDENDKHNYIKTITDKILEQAITNEQNHTNIKISNSQYEKLFKYSSIEDYTKRINVDKDSRITRACEDLTTLPVDYIFSIPIHFDELINNSNILKFIGTYGLKNIIDFDNENNHFFTEGNMFILSYMYLMYCSDINLNFAEMRSYPRYFIQRGNGKKYSPLEQYHQIEKWDTTVRTYTKDEFYEIIKRMIINGPKNYRYVDLASSYRNLTGEFRERNKELFLSEQAPEKLQREFYSKSVTPKLLVEHPEYIPYLNGKKIDCFFHPILIKVDNNYENFYSFIGQKLGSNGTLNLIVNYHDTLNIFYEVSPNDYDYDYEDGIDFSKDDNIDEIQMKMIRKFKKYIINKNRNSNSIEIPESIIRKYPSFFLESDAPESLQRIYYSYKPEIYLDFFNNHPEYFSYLKSKNLEDCLVPIDIKVDNRQHYENFYTFLRKKVGNNNFLDFIVEYKTVPTDIWNQSIQDINFSQEDSTEEIQKKINRSIKNELLKNRYRTMTINYLEIIPEIIIKHLDSNSPKELKERYYRGKITKEFILSNPEYIKYLKNADVELMFQYIPIQAQERNFVALISEVFKEEAFDIILQYFDIMLQYKEYMQIFPEESIIYSTFTKERYDVINKVTKKMLLDDMNKLLYKLIVDEGMKYDENIATNFKMNYPSFFLDKNIPEPIRNKFYNREFTLSDFNENPDLLDIFEKTNIGCGFSKELSWVIPLFSESTSIKEANIRRLKVILMYSKIQDNQLRNYILKNKDYFNNENIDTVINILTKIVYSNSSTLRALQDKLVSQVLETDEPLKTLEQIENIYIKKNLPTFGKVFLCFQILNPDLKKFYYGSESRIAPQLKDESLPTVLPYRSPTETRFLIIYNDLLRISYRSNCREFKNYVDNIEEGYQMYCDILQNNFEIKQYSVKERKTLEIFLNHLEALYANTKTSAKKVDFEQCSTVDKIKIFGELFEETSQYNLKDRIVRSFCYSAGIKSFDELRKKMDEAVKEADKRGRKYAKELKEKPFHFENGDFVRGIGDYRILGSTLQNGNVSKEFLTTFIDRQEKSDTTPLDIDLTLVKNPTDIYHSIENTPTGFRFGNIYIILRKNNPNLNITRDKNGNLTGAKYDPTKIELFGTTNGVFGYETHWGVRTGIAFTDVDYILYKKQQIIDSNNPYDTNGNVNYITTNDQSENIDDLSILKFEIARNGYYIPVIDFSGKLIFNEEEYEELHSKMQGLSYYGEEAYTFSNLLDFEESTEIIGELDNSKKSITEKRDKIIEIMNNIFQEFNLKVKEKIDGDLTPGTIEMLDTGSTGRDTNALYDGDFDFLLRIDQQIMKDDKEYKKLKDRILEEVKKQGVDEINITSDGDFRLKGLKLDDERTVDMDLSFVVKTDKLDYSSDECIRDRLNNIKNQNPEKYKQVLSNIIFAKKYLKENNVYKSRRSNQSQGGLGGIGIENWILQNGGSFLEAAKSFVEAAEGKSFEEFKSVYQIWDFGENHFALKRGQYPHDNFVANNMSKEGYDKMVSVLSKYIKERENGQDLQSMMMDVPTTQISQSKKM